MSKHKKQHYVPKCYLKAWCDPKCPPNHTPYIWIFEKESRKGKRKAPENIFHETDMYTIHDEAGNRDLKIEHGLSQMEDLFTTVRNKKFRYRKTLTHEEHSLICAFMAATHARTKSQLAHISDQWRGSLQRLDDLTEQIKTATEEEKQWMVEISNFGHSDRSGSFSCEEVREVVENPVGTIFLPTISVVAPLLEGLDFAILYMEVGQHFITTDSPCVWFDPEAYKRPPLNRGPGLAYPTIEITLPISPSQCILINRRGLQGYIQVHENVVREINRRHRFYADKFYIVNQDKVDDSWFDQGFEPEDSWEKQQKMGQRL